MTFEEELVMLEIIANTEKNMHCSFDEAYRIVSKMEQFNTYEDEEDLRFG